MNNTCAKHKIPFGMTCPVCDHATSYMVRGDIARFQEGYKDGFHGCPSRVDVQGSYQNKADYEDGFKMGQQMMKKHQAATDFSVAVASVAEVNPEEKEQRIKEIGDIALARRAELEPYFTLVTNPKDWKSRIDAVIPAQMRAKVRDAIAFFTSTEARFTAIDGDHTRLRVQAAGYRMGPAGP